MPNRLINKELLFLKSALTLDNPFKTTDEVILWLEKRNAEVSVNIEKIKLKALKQWSFEKGTGNLVHDSGKFFSIEGIQINTDQGDIRHWTQPIINQPEIGFLGILVKEMNGILYFLMQAKIEPGNVNNVQLSPTLQATKSNYTRAHKGKQPLYLEYFLDRKNTVLLDQLQSEQGARFLKKRNRNIIVLIKEDIPVYDDFCWLTLGQIKKLIQQDNLVNMDSRTVISGIPFGNYPSGTINFYNIIKAGDSGFSSDMLRSSLDYESSLNSFDDILSWLTHLKAFSELSVDRIPLNDVEDWITTDYDIRYESEKFFKVIGVNVEISNREVTSWMQPLIEPVQEGICAFIIKKINGVYHFLVQAKLECGNFDILEFAPTVQCLTGNYRTTASGSLPYLDYVLKVPKQRIRYDTLQSEEGGRFFREQNRNLIIESEEDFSESLPANYCWITLNQLKTFIRFNNYLNIQARSLISAISFYLELV